jgi:hypothetical protein
MTVHPTEQCVQTVFFIDTAELEYEACAGLTLEPARAAAVANPPTANPEPFKKARLSTTFSEALPMKDEVWEPIATPFVFFLSIVFLLKINNLINIRI